MHAGVLVVALFTGPLLDRPDGRKWTWQLVMSAAKDPRSQRTGGRFAAVHETSTARAWGCCYSRHDRKAIGREPRCNAFVFSLSFPPELFNASFFDLYDSSIKRRPLYLAHGPNRTECRQGWPAAPRLRQVPRATFAHNDSGARLKAIYPY